MKISQELLRKIKEAKTAENLVAMAKERNVALTVKQAEAVLAELKKTGELADEELDNVSGGCGDPEPAVKWGEPGQWDRSEDVTYEFQIGTRVIAYITTTSWKKGTVTAKESRKDDWGWYPGYVIHFDDSSVADEWFAQATVGKLL